MELHGSTNFNINTAKAGMAYSGQSVISENTEGKPVNNFVNLSNLSAGDLFKGNIADIQSNFIKIILTGNQTLTAKLDPSAMSNINLTIGQDVIFQVNENLNGKITIRPFMNEKYPAELLLKALDGAKLFPSEKNINIVKALIDNGMPIDKNTLNQVSLETSKYPDEDINNILSLHKLSVPVTDENLTGFKNYTNYEHRMSAEVVKITSDISEFMETESMDNRISLNRELLNMLTENVSEVSAFNDGNIEKSLGNPNFSNDFNYTVNQESDIPDGKSLAGEIFLNDGEGNSLTGEISLNAGNSKTEKIPVSEWNNILKELGLSDKERVIINDEKIPPKEKLQIIKKAVDNNETPEIIGRLTEKKEYQKLIGDSLKEELLLEPEKFINREDKKEAVKELYEKIMSHTERIIKAADSEGKAAVKLVEHCQDLKSNAAFVNDLNFQNAYIQLPIKLVDDSGNSELYVYNRKKGGNDSDAVTAFLHFDLNSLGATDIYVSLKKEAVNIKFSLEDADSVKLVDAHLNQLKEALNKKGYTAVLSAEKLEKENNAFDNILEENSKKSVIKRYSFDIRT